MMAHTHLERAAAYMKQGARPLERARYEWEFEAGSVEAVLDALRAYQNKDGGFGHGLEPDIRLKDSSVIATTTALQIMSDLQLDPEHPMVAEAIRYLLDVYDTGKQGWEIVPYHVDQAPHAPWWNYRDLYDGWGNPNLEIVGYLYEFPHGPLEFREKITEHAVQYMLERSPLNEFHELLCALRMIERMPDEDLAQVLPKVDEMVSSCVSTDSSQWKQYVLTPLQIVRDEDSRYFSQFQEYIQTNLKHLMSNQQADGAWHPVWSWGQHEEAWEEAKQEWKGLLTLDAIRSLKRFEAYWTA